MEGHEWGPKVSDKGGRPVSEGEISWRFERLILVVEESGPSQERPAG